MAPTRPLQAPAAQCRLLLATAVLGLTTVKAQTRDLEFAEAQGNQTGALSEEAHETDRIFALAVAVLACVLVGCICLAMAFPQLFGRRRQEAEKARKERKVVTSEEILEKLPPAKTPRASDGQDQPNCVVCLCEVDVDEDSITTQCGHTFHKECVLQWWTHKPRRSIRCPTCRTKQKIRSKADKGKASPTSQVSPAIEELDIEEGPESNEAEAQQGGHQRQGSWLPDLETGLPQRALDLPAASPSAFTEATHLSVADEATPMSEASEIPLPAAHREFLQASGSTESI